jgi:hypothetical protein
MWLCWVDDGGDQSGLEVVDVTRDADLRRHLGRRQQPVHVGADGDRRVDDRPCGEHCLVQAGAAAKADWNEASARNPVPKTV